MKTLELDEVNFETVCRILYMSEDGQMYHGTSSLDKFSKGTLKVRLKEMIDCDEHDACKVLTELFKRKE